MDAATAHAMILVNRANIQLSLDPAAALQTLQAGTKIVAALRAHDPKSSYFLRLHHNYLNVLASTYIRNRTPALALPVINEIRAFANVNLQRDPGDLAALDILGRTAPLSGIALTALHRFDDARAAHASAVAEASATLQRFPSDLFFLRNRAWALEASGDFYSIRGDKAQAASFYRRAIDDWSRWASLASPAPSPNLSLNAINQKLANPSTLSLILQGVER